MNRLRRAAWVGTGAGGVTAIALVLLAALHAPNWALILVTIGLGCAVGQTCVATTMEVLRMVRRVK